MTNINENINYRTFFPLSLFILVTYILFLLVAGNEEQAVFIMVLSFIIYIGNNVVVNINGISNLFNEYLEDMAVFFNFGISTILFGLIFYKDNLFVLSVVIFYSITIILGLARNWVLGFKNTKGWPLGLNGLFFPLFYYIYKFYLQGPGDSIFILFYIAVGFLSITNYNFLSSESKFLEDFMNPKTGEEIIIKKRVADKIIEEKIKLDKEKKKVENFKDIIDKDTLEEFDNFKNNKKIENEEDSKDNIEQEDKIINEKIVVDINNQKSIGKKEIKEVFAPKHQLFGKKLKKFFYRTFTSNKSKVTSLFEDDNYNERVTQKEVEEVLSKNSKVEKQEQEEINISPIEERINKSQEQEKNIEEEDIDDFEKSPDELYIEDLEKDPNELIYIDENQSTNEKLKINTDIFEDSQIYEPEQGVIKKDEINDVFNPKKTTFKSKLKKFFYQTFTSNKSKVTPMFKDDENFGTSVSKEEVEEVLFVEDK